MNRLTKKHRFLELYIAKENVPQHIAFDKLGQLEDIEDELGCPLEVVFEALKEGICCVDYDNQIIRVFKVPLCFNSTSKQFYWSGNNIGYPDLKDYGKTWWLKGEKNEKEN